MQSEINWDSKPKMEKIDTDRRPDFRSDVKVKKEDPAVRTPGGGSSLALFSDKFRQTLSTKLQGSTEIVKEIENLCDKHPAAVEGLEKILAHIFDLNDSNRVPEQAKANTPSSGTFLPYVESNDGSDIPFPLAENAGCVVPQLSCVRPRGKHDVEFHRDCIFFRAKKVEKSLSVSLEAIEQIFVLRRIEKFQKQEVTSFVIRLKDDCEISFGKQIFDELVITLKTKQGKPSLVSVPISDTVKLPTTETSSSSKPLPSEFLDMPREEILLKIFKYFVAKQNIVESSKKVFCSSQGDTSVKCIVGVENGHLYPLRNGVYFLNKPYIFLPFDDMVGLEQGRAGSGRTTDFIVSMDNGDVHQFGMISTDETEHLSEYMQFVKKKLSKRRVEGNNNTEATSENGSNKEATGKGVDGDATEEDEANDDIDDEEDDDEDDDDDDDFDVEEARKNIESDSETSDSDEEDDADGGLLDDSAHDTEEDDSAVSDDAAEDHAEADDVEMLEDDAEVEQKMDTTPMHPPPQKKQKTTSNAVASKQKQSSISSFFVKRS